jgi:2-polyprenyl-3-methyl-5-hydroxy-6-metoxy-1,4-benzoquinol methylase
MIVDVKHEGQNIVVLLEEVRCNLCGSRDGKIYFNINGYTYRKCRKCGLVYQSPRPVFEELRNHYDEDYFDYEFSNQENFFNLMKLGLRDIGFDGLFKDSSGKRFLDIGCATGLLLKFLRENGWETTGVEICEPSARYGIEHFGLNIFIGTLHQANFPDHYFDVVHLSHLIEHVPDPLGLLVEIKRVLKPDGHMILTTPNIGGFQARISGNNWRSAIPEHIYLFSKKTMRRLLEVVGFRVIKQLSWGGIPAGKRPEFIKRPADRIAKLLNIGDVMLFHCKPCDDN